MTYLLIWNDRAFGTVSAPYATEHDAVTQALHDMALGKEIQHVQDSDTGAVIWSHDQLTKALYEGTKRG